MEAQTRHVNLSIQALLHHETMCVHAVLLIKGGVTSFKATDKKVVNKNQAQQQDTAQEDEEGKPWHRMKNLGDMEGTLDGWVLFASFSISLITALVGAFGMIDKPYTAQVWRVFGNHVSRVAQ